MSDPDYRKYYQTGGSTTVDFYSLFNQTVYVTFKDGRTTRSRTLRDRDALRRALVKGSLTTTPPLDHLREEAAA